MARARHHSRLLPPLPYEHVLTEDQRAGAAGNSGRRSGPPAGRRLTFVDPRGFPEILCTLLRITVASVSVSPALCQLLMPRRLQESPGLGTSGIALLGACKSLRNIYSSSRQIETGRKDAVPADDSKVHPLLCVIVIVTVRKRNRGYGLTKGAELEGQSDHHPTTLSRSDVID